jgi:hypothetical protein
MVGAADWLGRIIGVVFVEPARLRETVRRVLFTAAVIVVAATPVTRRDYLARRYQNWTDELAFLAALHEVPAECGLIVPDDEVEGRGGVEVFVRYRAIAAEAMRRREVSMNPHQVVGLQAFRRAAESQSHLPRFADVRMHFFEVARDRDAPSCWYFYAGTYCAPGLPSFPTGRCREFLAAEPHLTVATWPIEFLSHRLVTWPDLQASQLYDTRRVLALYHLTRQ